MATEPQLQCPVHAGFDPLTPGFLADPYAVLASLPRRGACLLRTSIDYYVVTRYADIEAVFLDPATYSAAPAQLPLVPLVPEARRDPARRRAQAAAVDGQPRPAGAHASASAHRRARSRRDASRRWSRAIRATVDELLDAVDPDAPFDLVSALDLPAAGDHRSSPSWASPRPTGPAQGVVRPPRRLAWGRPTPGGTGAPRREMAAYRGYLRELVATKVTRAATTLPSALLAIHDEDPEALTHEEIASILFSLQLRGARDDEPPDRQHRAAAA